MGFSRERFEAGFKAEAEELLLRIERGIAALGTGGGAALIEGMARAAHTLRGSSTMMGRLPVAAMARLVEEFLWRAHAGGATVGRAQLAQLGECVRSIRALLDDEAGARGRAEDVAERAARLFGGGDA